MSLQGVRSDGGRLLCMRRARLLCWLVLCDLTLRLFFRWFLVLMLGMFVVSIGGCVCWLYVFHVYGGTRRLETSACKTDGEQ